MVRWEHEASRLDLRSLGTMLVRKDFAEEMLCEVRAKGSQELVP